MEKTAEQEALELEQLKNNSPYALPDNAAESGWTTAQIKEKFYAGLFYLYRLFKELRTSENTFEGELNDRITELESATNQILNNLIAQYDIDGNAIVSTYAKITKITDGTLPVLKYITANGGSAEVRQIASDLSTFMTTINSYFSSDSAKKALLATKAQYDESGHKFENYYATLASATILQQTLINITNGTTAVSKALNDYQGNAIHTSYIKISNIIDSLNDTSTSKPLSANQGKVLKGYIDAINLLLASNDTDLDTVQEIVTYIKNNKTLIENITSSKVNTSDIIDNLTTEVSGKPLSANQGYVLKGLIDALTIIVNAKADGNNVYTIEQINTLISGLVFADIDDELDEESENAVQNKVVVEGLESKANTSGEYPLLTVGKSLTSKQIENINDEVGSTQTTPFNFQATGTDNNTTATPTAPVAKHLELRGNSVVWNQLFRTQDYSAESGGITITRNATNGIITISGTATEDVVFAIIPSVAQVNLILTHKYLYKWNFNGSINDNSLCYAGQDKFVGWNQHWDTDGIGLAQQTNSYLQCVVKTGAVVDFSIQPQIIDLTLLGKDYDSVLAFNRDYPLPYYSYNAGTLKSCKSSKLVTIGCNQFDGEIEGGYINSENGTKMQDISNRCRTKNYINVIAGQTYILSCEFFKSISDKNKRIRIYEYDGNHNYLGYQSSLNATDVSELSAQLSNNTHYILFDLLLTDSTWTSNPPSQDIAQIMFRLSWDEQHDYVDHDKHEYALPVQELRSAGSVYDVLYANGTGKKRIGVAKLKDLSWSYVSASTRFVSSSLNGLIVRGFAYGSRVPNIICNKYEVSANKPIFDQTKDKAISLIVDNNVTYVAVRDTDYTGATAFKNHFTDDDYLFYELLEETDIETTAFTENIIVDDFGTMEFVPSDDNLEPIIPQGNKFFYPADYVLFLDDLYNRSKDGGDDADVNNIVTQSQLTHAISEIPTPEVNDKVSTSFSGLAEYSNSSTYTVGAKCWYNGKLYVCNTAVSVAEDFNSTKWTEITLNDIIYSLLLKNELDFGDGAKVYKDSSNRVCIKYGNADRVKFGSGNIFFGARLDPDGTQNIGRDAACWNYGYFNNLGNQNGTTSMTDILALITYAKSQGWIS